MLLVMIGAVEPYGVTIKTMPHPIQSVHLRIAEGTCFVSGRELS